MSLSPQARTTLLAVAIGGGTFLFVGIAVAVLVISRTEAHREVKTASTATTTSTTTRPRADNEGVNWSPRELEDYLFSKGIVLRQGYGTEDGNGPYGMYRDAAGLEVTIRRCPTAERAQELAKMKSDREFAWGRFEFYAKNLDTLKQMQQLLD